MPLCRAEVVPRFRMEGSMLSLEPHHGLEYPCKSTLCTCASASLPIVGVYRGHEAHLVTIDYFS